MATPTKEDKDNRQKSREQMERTVGGDFKKIVTIYPKEKVTCLFETLATRYRKQAASVKYQRQNGAIDMVKFPTTGQGVRNILVRLGIYKVQQGQ